MIAAIRPLAARATSVVGGQSMRTHVIVLGIHEGGDRISYLVVGPTGDSWLADYDEVEFRIAADVFGQWRLVDGIVRADP